MAYQKRDSFVTSCALSFQIPGRAPGSTAYSSGEATCVSGHSCFKKGKATFGPCRVWVPNRTQGFYCLRRISSTSHVERGRAGIAYDTESYPIRYHYVACVCLTSTGPALIRRGFDHRIDCTSINLTIRWWHDGDAAGAVGRRFLPGWGLTDVAEGVLCCAERLAPVQKAKPGLSATADLRSLPQPDRMAPVKPVANERPDHQNGTASSQTYQLAQSAGSCMMSSPA